MRQQPTDGQKPLCPLTLTLGPRTHPQQELLGELGAHLSSKRISVEKALRIVYQPQVGRPGCGPWQGRASRWRWPSQAQCVGLS